MHEKIDFSYFLINLPKSVFFYFERNIILCYYIIYNKSKTGNLALIGFWS